MATPGILHPMVFLVIGFLYLGAVLSAERGSDKLGGPTKLPDEPQKCPENQFYCRSRQQCMPEERRGQCTQDDKSQNDDQSQSECPENEKHCRTKEGHKCIPTDQKCVCGKGMEYCNSTQQCILAERMKNPDECPLVCDKGKFYCRSRQQCMPEERRGQCTQDDKSQNDDKSQKECPKNETHCRTKEGHKCIPTDQKCVCGKGMEYCNSTQQCILAERMKNPDECPPVCDKGKKHCRTKEGHKCIPTDQKCVCGKGMEYCNSTQHCILAERMKNPDECPPVCDKGKFYCRSRQQCMPEERHGQCTQDDKSQKECPENEKHCRTKEGHKCIPTDQKCVCGKGMEYCNSTQHCILAERMKNPDECPSVCDKGKTECGHGRGTINGTRTGDGTRPEDCIFVGTISAHIAKKEYLISAIVKPPKFSKAIVQGMINKMGTWQVSKRVGRTTTWNNLTEGLEILSADKLRFQPRDSTVHGFSGIKLKIDGKIKYIGIIVMPCFMPELEILAELSGTEDTPLEFNFNNFFNVTREGSSKSNLVDKYNKCIPARVLEEYKAALVRPLGENLGVYVFIPARLGSIDEKSKEKVVSVRKQQPLNREHKMKILSKNRTLVLRLAKDYFGDEFIKVLPVDVPSGTKDPKRDECAIGREFKFLSIKIENVNDKPSIRRGELNQPLLNIRAPPLPYELKNDEGFDISNVARKVCLDNDRDHLGIAVVEADKTKIGEWQYLNSSGVWKSIVLTENNISREAEIIGEKAKLIFLTPGRKIRFKPVVKTKLWTAGEGMDYTTARFVCWDQSNELKSGLHTVSLKYNGAISKKVISVIVQRRGCDGKESSMKRLNECKRCGAKSCRKCDRTMNSTAYINHCGHCVLGVTGKNGSFGVNCKDGCSLKYTRVKACGNTCHREGTNLNDCAGVACGTARLSRCGNCSKDPKAGLDACGVCNGDNSTCLGCDGVPRSGKVKDLCNKCRSRKSPEFNTGCMSLGRLTPKSCAKGEEQKFEVDASGLPKDGIVCAAVLGEIKVKASNIVSENGKSLKFSLPAISTPGRYKVSCTIGGVKPETKDNLTFVVYDRETLKVTNVEPAEIDVGSNVTDVLVTGTGIVDTGDVYCFFEAKSDGRAKSSARKVLNRNEPTIKQIPAERISDTQVKCKVGKMLRSQRVKLSIGFSKHLRIPSSLQLTWLAKAPRIVRHSLNYRLRRIIITFDRSVQRMKNCDELLDQNTMTKLKGLDNKKIGKVECKRTRLDQVVVFLPRYAILKDDIKIKFKTGALKANEAYSRSSSPEITIKAPNMKVVPVAIITAPHKLSSSGYARVSGRNSINTGGKKFSCFWKLRVEDEDALNEKEKADVVSVREKLSKLNSVSACAFFIGRDNLKPGIKYWLELKVVNFMNETSKIVEHMIERATGEIPTLKFVTRVTTFDMSKFRFTMRVKAKRSELINSKINFLWSSVSDTDLELKNNERNLLVLYRNKLECNRIYEFNIRAFIATDTRLFSSLNINITTIPAILKTVILKGDRVVSVNDVIQLKARTKSRGTCRGKLVHSFSCVDEGGFDCLVTDKNGKRKLLDLQSRIGSFLVLRANQFEVNKTYTFTVIVSKGQQEANHSVDITIAPGDPPSVEFKTPKIGTERSSITAIIKTSFNSTYFGWEIVDKPGYGDLDLDDKRISGKLSGTFGKSDKKRKHVSRRVSLMFKKDVLVPGVKYRLRLSVFSEDLLDQVGEGLGKIETNAPPYKGTLLVEPWEGVAQNTSFSLKASGFYDDDLPLTYLFFYKKGEGKPRPLRAASEESSIDVMLPSGDGNDNNTLLLIVKVTDTYGASSRVETLVKVTPAQITSEDISKAVGQAAELASQGDYVESLAVSGVILDETEGQSETDQERSNMKETRSKVLIEALDSAVFKDVLPFARDADPQTDESKGGIASGMKASVDKLNPKDIIRDSETASPSKGVSARRRRRAVEDDTSSEEEEEEEEEASPGLTRDELENVLATFENLIDTTVINNITKDFLQTVDNLLVSMCRDLPVGEASLASSSLAVLRADKNYMDNVDDTFLDVSCANCSSKINHTALVKFGSELKDLYNEWNCTGGAELCNGVCAAMVQYPHDFITADNSSTRRSDVVYIGLKNPETADYIPVLGLTSSALVHIPLHAGNLASGKYECSIWDTSNAQWSTSDCVNTQVLSQNGALFVECNCTRLGFITVNALPVQNSGSSTDGDNGSSTEGNNGTSTEGNNGTSTEGNNGTSTEGNSETSTLVSPTQEPTSLSSTQSSTSGSSSSTEAPRLTADVSFYFDVVYDNIVNDDSTTKEQLEDVIEKKLAEVMKVHVSMILNVTISKGSIHVSFIILSPDDKPVSYLNYSISLLQMEVDKGEFTLTMRDGVQITADNKSVVYIYKSVSGIQPDPTTTDTKTTEDDDDSNLPLILGCVLGVVLLIVIVLVVIYKRQLVAKNKVSHENIRSSQPMKNDCVENPAYEGSVGSEPGADVRQTAELPQADASLS